MGSFPVKVSRGIFPKESNHNEVTAQAITLGKPCELARQDETGQFSLNPKEENKILGDEKGEVPRRIFPHRGRSSQGLRQKTKGRVSGPPSPPQCLLPTMPPAHSASSAPAASACSLGSSPWSHSLAVQCQMKITKMNK